MDWKSKQRFTDRAGHYAAHRPSYPPALIDLLGKELGLRPGNTVADIGAGTGILAEQLLSAGCKVCAVEPNGEMRAEAESRFAGNPSFVSRFHSIDGSAEATGLDPDSVDLIVAAQAFHWFEPEATAREFRRILRPGGRVAVIWIHRPPDRPAVGAAYEQFLLREVGEEYRKMRQLWTDAPQGLDRFFRDGPDGHQTIEVPEEMTLRELTGRMQSYSFVPPPGSEGFERLAGKLREFFAMHAEGGAEKDGETITLLYRTDLYWGQL